MSLEFVQDLQEKVQAEIDILEQQIKGKKGVKFLIKTRCSINSLKSILHRLDRINELLKIKEYNIAFIGKIGVGKTTAICHLFNLLVSREILIEGGRYTPSKSR